MLSQMNVTERRARQWLLKQYESVIFRHNDSPDFIAPDGKGYEVKPFKGYTINLQATQWEKLIQSDKCFIIIFNENPEPLEIIPVKELKPPQKWGRYQINVIPDALAKYKLHLEILAQVSGRGLSGKEFWDEYRKVKNRGLRSHKKKVSEGEPKPKYD